MDQPPKKKLSLRHLLKPVKGSPYSATGASPFPETYGRGSTVAQDATRAALPMPGPENMKERVFESLDRLGGAKFVRDPLDPTKRIKVIPR